MIISNNVKFKTTTKSGVDISTQILDRFNIDYSIKVIK